MNATELRAFLRDRFDDAELRQLAFDLDIPFEDLGGADIGKNARIQALIEWCVRRDRLGDLEQATRLARRNTVQKMSAEGGMGGGFPPVDYSQIQRLIAVTDEMNKSVHGLSTDVQLLQRDVNRIEERLDKMEARTTAAQAPSWQSWGVSVAALVFAVLAILAMANLR